MIGSTRWIFCPYMALSDDYDISDVRHGHALPGLIFLARFGRELLAAIICGRRVEILAGGEERAPASDQGRGRGDECACRSPSRSRTRR